MSDEKPLPKGIVRSREKTRTEAPTPPPTSRVPGSPADGRGESLNGRRSNPGRGTFTGTPLPSAGVGVSRITALEPQAKREGRVNVFVDGKFTVGVYEDVAVALGLRVGQAITPERLEEIAHLETVRRAREDAFLLLSYRARSEKEVADRLQKRDYEPEVVSETLTFLRNLGFLNDESFAQRWAESRGTTRGRRALAFELRQKGVAAETAAEALETTYGDDGERDAARLAAVKKVGERPADQSREARARLAAFLTRRGFGWDSIRPILAELYQGNAEDTADASGDED